MKGWIGFDLDGTLATKYWGRNGVKFDPAVIGDPVEPPIKDYPSPVDRVKRLLEEGVTVKIFTARVYCPPKPANEHDTIAMEEYSRRRNEAESARAAIYKWCAEHIGQTLEVTCTKDYGMILLFDDLVKQVAQNTGIVLEDFVSVNDVIAKFAPETPETPESAPETPSPLTTEIAEEATPATSAISATDEPAAA